MARPGATESLDALHAAVRASAAGLSLAEVMARFPQTPKRTLQRWLARLAESDALSAMGAGPSRRYFAASTVASVSAQPDAATAKAELKPEFMLPLSAEGDEQRQLIRRPIAQRNPVGYVRSFLDGYVPNQSRYLPQDLRVRLHELGRSPVGERPAGTYARQILDRLLIDLSWSSSRLEGNTYTRLDTQNLIEFGHLAEGKDRLQAQMILNHKAAIEMLVEQADEIGFNRYTLQNLHALLAQNLLPDAAAEGRLRRIEVAISGTVYHPLAVPQQIDEYFERFLAKASAIDDPFEQAFFAMVHIPYLQPFEDVNKRVSRLAANIPLIRENLAPLSFVDVPEDIYVDGNLGVYELNRIELLRDVFAWAYERSCRRYTVIRDTLPEPDSFRLQYRQALIDVISSIVENRVLRDDAARIRELARSHVPDADLDSFVAMILRELHHLNENNSARYRLRPSLFRAWQNLHEKND
jgi:Fic family protein